jgi:hypothetical protein
MVTTNYEPLCLVTATPPTDLEVGGTPLNSHPPHPPLDTVENVATGQSTVRAS